MITTQKKDFNSYHYLGAIHIHSKFSDGSKDVNSISKAAKKAGLDWIIITDHNSLAVEEGYYNGVCVIKGEEISPSAANHYLAFNINKPIVSTISKEFTNEVRKQGGFGFIAHPDESDERKNSYTPIKWLDENIIPDGVEIWNWLSQWADNLNDKNIFSLIYAYLFKNRLVTEPNKKTMNRWDLLNNNSKEIIPAIGGVDAHAMKIKDYLIPVTVFPYEKMFKTITNVLTFNEPLSEDFETRKSQILNAVKEGNNLIINRNVDKSIPEINFIGGSKIQSDDISYLIVKTKKKTSIKIKNRGFAYSNPILVY